MAQVLVDTSAVYALIDRHDVNHRAARRTLEAIKKRRLEPLLTNFIIAESHALILSRVDTAIARRWLLANVWPVERVTEADEDRARTIVAQFVDKTFSYTDATSFGVMERLGIKSAFAFDAQFRQYGFQVIGS